MSQDSNLIGYIVSMDEFPEPYEDWEYPVAVFICDESASNFVTKLKLEYPAAYINTRKVPLRGDLRSLTNGVFV